ncbi:MAG: TonB-dependent receptor, partial [Marinicaulis sp.]|nr:TonB-dependent receptor [Marinicaulis sp.]
SGLISNTWDTNGGAVGLQFGYAYSALNSRTDASQVTDPCYRTAPFDAGACIRAIPVMDGGFGDTPAFDETNFPPAGAVIVPKGAGVRTTDLKRTREAFSTVGQWESSDGRWLATFEWLRSKTNFETEEFSLLAQVNDEANIQAIPQPGTTWTFDDNGLFQSGILSRTNAGGYASPFGGLPFEGLRFERAAEAITQDFSFDLDFTPTDRLRFNVEAQRVTSDLQRDSIIGAMQSWADIALDLSGKTPQVEFVTPAFVPGAPGDYLSSGFYTYYWFALDSRELNEGDLDSLRFDGEYDISEGFIKRARFGARWADRDRVTRNTNFSTWGNLSAPWAGRAGCAPWGAGPGCGASGPGPFGNGFIPGRLYTGLPGQEFATGGGAFTDEFPEYSQLLSPFGDGFQRGNAPAPIANGASWFFGGDDFLGEYLAGETDQQVDEINAFSQTPNATYGVNGRSETNTITGETFECAPFCPSEISDVSETTVAAYARIDFGHDLDNGWVLDGNVGVRYVETEIGRSGIIGFPVPNQFDDPANGGNGDGIAQVSEITGFCGGPALALPDLPGVCSLSSARQAEYAAALTGEAIIDDQEIKFDNWLPSFNVKLDVGNGLLFRGAVSKGISRPDLQLFRGGGRIVDNTAALRDAGNLETGPLFTLATGNRNLRPITSWNYDLSAEWYFSNVGSVTLSLFMKDIEGFVNTGFDTVSYTSDSGTNLDVLVQGPVNDQGGTLKGIEFAHQQTYDFLPGVLSGLGTQVTYTYVDGSDFSNPNLRGFGQSSVTSTVDPLGGGLFVANQPLAGISEHTVNGTVFYERGPLAMRAAYNWRSAFLITPRDDIFPYSPIWQEPSGQLDASIFYAVTDNVKLGVQAVNLLDTVTETTQVIDFDGTRVTRSAFRNDRRYTFLMRFSF